MKKFVALLALLMIVTAVPVFGNTEKIDHKVQYLIDNEIVKGRTEDDFALDSSITRAEMSRLIVEINQLTEVAELLKGVRSSYTDLNPSHWANGYIIALSTTRKDKFSGQALVKGYPDGRFLPEKDISLAELATILVRSHKSGEKDWEKDLNYPGDYLGIASELGLLEDLEKLDTNKPLKRRDAFVLIYNSLELLKKTDKNQVDFGEQMGIISRYQDYTIEINQEKTYKLTANTKYTDGTSLLNIAENSVEPGSLVRFIANEEGEIEYILEMGNPRDLAQEGRWEGVAESIVSSKDNTYFKDNYTESYEITVGDINAYIDEDTRFFSTDIENNSLKENKAPSEIFNKYVEDRESLKNVYMAYDTAGGRNFAKVIVFGQIEKYQGKEELRRVVHPVNSQYKIGLESATMGVTKFFNMNRAGFPDQFTYNPNDILRIKFDSYEGANILETPQVMLDYENDNVYEVIRLDERLIVLRDKDGYVFPYNMDFKTLTFMPEDLKVGSHVQILFMPPKIFLDFVDIETGEIKDFDDIDLIEIIKDIKDIDSLSYFAFDTIALNVVDKDLKGSMEMGLRDGQHGYIKEIAGNTITIVDRENGRDYNHRSYQISGTDKTKAMFFYINDIEIVYDTTTRFGGTEYIYNIDYYFNYSRLFFTEMDEFIFQVVRKSLDGLELTREDMEELGALYRRAEANGSKTNLFREKTILEAAKAIYNARAAKLGMEKI